MGSLNKATQASEIASFLQTELIGNDIPIINARSLDKADRNSIVFCQEPTEPRLSLLEGLKDIFVLITEMPNTEVSFTYCLCENPRLRFAEVLHQFFVSKSAPKIAKTAVIDPSAVIADGVSIGEYCVIGAGVQIGKDTSIGDFVKITDSVVIGSHCHIKSGCIIGEEGFGFEFDESETPLRIPHLGSVIIGNYVEVGSLTAIARGTLDDTVLEDYVKIDDHVFIAHNVHIGEKSLIIAGAEVSGSVKVGKRVWIAPQASITHKTQIGDDALIGIGSVVIKPVAENTIVAGNPAKPLRTRKPNTSQ